MATNSYEQVQNKVKEALKRRGDFGLTHLRRAFKIFDDNGNMKLSKVELKKGLSDFGINLGSGEIDLIFKQYDANNDGEVDFNEFLVALRGELNPVRRALVKRAYDEKLDVNKDGKVTLEDIKKVYIVTKHPKYINGEKTQDEILTEFLAGFEVKGQKDGILTFEEFENYYAEISASVDSDPYFTQMMFNAWKL